MSKLLAARTTPEILKALYEAIWLKRNPGKDYSENRQPPTEAAIASWLPDYPQEARDEANAVLVQVIPDLGQSPVARQFHMGISRPDRSTRRRAAGGDGIRQGTATGAVQVRHGGTRQRGQRNHAPRPGSDRA